MDNFNGRMLVGPFTFEIAFCDENTKKECGWIIPTLKLPKSNVAEQVKSRGNCCPLDGFPPANDCQLFPSAAPESKTELPMWPLANMHQMHVVSVGGNTR